MWTQRTPDGILNCFVSPDATETFIESCDGRIVGRYLLAMSSRRRPRPASWREGPLRLGRSSPLTDVLCAARSCTRLNGGSQAVSSLSRTVYAPVLMYRRGLLFILCSTLHVPHSMFHMATLYLMFHVLWYTDLLSHLLCVLFCISPSCSSPFRHVFCEWCTSLFWMLSLYLYILNYPIYVLNVYMFTNILT